MQGGKVTQSNQHGSWIPIGQDFQGRLTIGWDFQEQLGIGYGDPGDTCISKMACSFCVGARCLSLLCIEMLTSILPAWKYFNITKYSIMGRKYDSALCCHLKIWLSVRQDNSSKEKNILALAFLWGKCGQMREEDLVTLNIWWKKRR